MNILFTTVAALPIILSVKLQAQQAPQVQADLISKTRLLTIGGTVSEIVCSLGECSRIIATDSSSLFPESLSKLPQVGYSRSLSVEGILAQNPEFLLLSDEAGPPAALSKLKSLNIKFKLIDSKSNLEAARSRIAQIGELLGRPSESQKLLADLESDLKKIQSQRSGIDRPLRVLFIYARGLKVLNVAGRDTAATALIEIAGATAVGGDFSGYKPLTPEALAGAAPELILMTQSGVASLGGEQAIWQLPGLKLTPAYQSQSLVVMDELLLLGMGPRLGQAGLELMRKFYPKAPWLKPLSTDNRK